MDPFILTLVLLALSAVAISVLVLWHEQAENARFDQRIGQILKDDVASRESVTGNSDAAWSQFSPVASPIRLGGQVYSLLIESKQQVLRPLAAVRPGG